MGSDPLPIMALAGTKPPRATWRRKGSTRMKSSCRVRNAPKLLVRANAAMLTAEKPLYPSGIEPATGSPNAK